MRDLFGVEVGGSAVVSDDRLYRYRLGRRWDAGHPVLFVMLNPSVADAVEPDPTLRRCIGFAKRERFGALEVVNLYGWISTEPDGLAQAADPVGPGNDAAILRAVQDTQGPIIAAWGAHHMAKRRAGTVLRLLPSCRTVYALRVTREGWPEHPARLPGHVPLVRYRCEHPTAAHTRAERASWCSVPGCGCAGPGRYCGEAREAT